MAELSLLVKATFILVCALLGVRLARPASAAVRSLMLAGAFGLLLLLPAVSSTLPVQAIEVPARYSAPFAAPVASVIAPSPAQQPDLQLARDDSPRAAMPSLAFLLQLGWAAGAIGFMMPLLIGLARLRRLRRDAQAWPVAPAPSGVASPARLLMHPSVTVPITFGALNPVVVLPIDAPGWSPADVRRVLLHELEHVRRHDWLVHIAARAICALYWFHPMVWMAWRRLCLESERACDDAVLRQEDGVAYAAQLVALARRVQERAPVPMLSMAGRSNLSTRVGAVLATRLARRPVPSVMVLGVVALIAVAGVSLGPLQAVTARQRPVAPLTGSGMAFDSSTLRRTDAAKPVEPTCCVVRYSANGTVSGRNVGLVNLIASAYDAYGWQIEGVPAWAGKDYFVMEGERFDLEATAPPGVATDDMRRMLKTMLADRFGLAMHLETRTRRSYELVVEPGGHRMLPPGDRKYGEGDDIWLRVDPETLVAHLRVDQWTMAQLARHLGSILLTKVDDRTDLPGSYGVYAEWSAIDPPVFPDRTIFAALPQQLGLRLRETTGPVEFLAIDHVERPALDVAR